MKKQVITALCSILFLNTTYALDNHYSIIIDAGSTGSRVHLFEYNTDQSVPKIEDILSVKVSPGLSSFAQEPGKAGESLKPLLNSVSAKLDERKIPHANVEVHVLATAGMRLLPADKQKEIYDNVKAFIVNPADNYGFKLGEVGTIDGTKEALYGWLDVNYLAKNFQNHTPTMGAIDMGGASTQISVEAPYTANDTDIIRFELDGQKYAVFAKSFLGLGQDMAREDMNKTPHPEVCYPNGYAVKSDLPGRYNYTFCSNGYKQVIFNHHIAAEIPPYLASQKFYAFSGAFYTYDFFKVGPHTTLSERIQTVCNEPWEQLVKEYSPKVSEAFLSAYCAHGSYQNELFYGVYGLKNENMQVVDKINGQGIDWTLGALLYNLVKE